MIAKHTLFELLFRAVLQTIRLIFSCVVDIIYYIFGRFVHTEIKTKQKKKGRHANETECLYLHCSFDQRISIEFVKKKFGC